jgi:hypothetical protein
MMGACPLKTGVYAEDIVMDVETKAESLTFLVVG